GRVLYPTPLTLLPTVGHSPELVKNTRYLLALLGPVLLAASIVLLGPRLRLTRRSSIALAGLAQLVGVVVVVACFAKQAEPGWQLAFFTVTLLAGAAAGAI